MTFDTADDSRHLARWVKTILVAIIIVSVPIGLYSLAGSAFLLTFGPGNQSMKWMPEHVLVFQVATCSVLFGSGATLSLMMDSARPLFASFILAALVTAAALI